MLLGSQRQEIVDCCLKMAADKLTVGTSGNVSVRVDNLVAITPSGAAYDTMTASDIVVMKLDGTILEGVRPSSEVPLHLTVYGATDADAIVHTHPVWSTVVGTLVDEVPLIHYMLAPCGGAVRVAPYAQFGSEELAQNVRRALEGRRGVLMRNHGALTYGATLDEAYEASVYLEWVCEVWAKAKTIGDPTLLTAEQVAAVVASFAAGRKG